MLPTLKLTLVFAPGLEISCADPEGGGGGAGVPDPPPPEKSQKHRASQQHCRVWPDPLKISQSHQASIQCWANIGTPAKRHLNGVSLAGR